MIRSVEINDTQFQALVLKAAMPVLLECASPECIICKTMSERIQEAGKEYGTRVVFLRLNINENKKWQDFNVRVIPTLLYFKDGVLVARQDTFPDVEEIQAQLKSMTAPNRANSRFYEDFKTAIDLEYVASRFYNHVFTNTRNGKVKAKFRRIHEESLVHKELLEGKLRELTGAPYKVDEERKFEGLDDLSPQSFSLIGALKMALRIEERLLDLYKKLHRNKTMAGGLLFKKCIKEEAAHVKELQKEMKFVHSKELISSMESMNAPSWFKKVF